MGRFGGCGSGGPEVARSAAHKASPSARTGAGGRMRPVWRRYTRKRSRASSRALNWGQRVARLAGSVRVVSTSSCLGESIMRPSFAVPSHRRLDILVVAVQVRRIIRVLQRDEALVVRTEGLSHPLLALQTQGIDVDPAARKRLHPLPCLDP